MLLRRMASSERGPTCCHARTRSSRGCWRASRTRLLLAADEVVHCLAGANYPPGTVFNQDLCGAGTSIVIRRLCETIGTSGADCEKVAWKSLRYLTILGE